MAQRVRSCGRRAGYCESKLLVEGFGFEKLERAFRQSPAHPFVKIWIVDSYLRSGWNEQDAEKAAAYWLRALEIDPSYTEYYYQIEVKFLLAGKSEQALRWFGEASDRGFNSEWVYVWSGVAYLELGQHRRAISVLRQGLRMNPSNTEGLYRLAGAYAAAGDYQSWAATLEEYLLLKPDDLATRESLAQMYVYWTANIRRSVHHLSHLLQHYPDHEKAAQWRYDRWRRAERRIRVFFEYELQGPLDGDFAFILPVRNAYQNHQTYRIEPEPRAHEVFSRHGNMYLKADFVSDPQIVVVAVDLALRPMSFYQGDRFLPFDSDDTPDRHLGFYEDNSVELNPLDPNLLALAREIVEDEEDTVSKARRIHDWIFSHFTYEVIVYPTIADYLRTSKGERGGYALFFTALSRAAGIPARRVFSPIFMGDEINPELGSHMTSEFFDPRYGWVPVDNTGNLFGSSVTVLQCWRQGAAGDDERVIYPGRYWFEKLD